MLNFYCNLDQVTPNLYGNLVANTAAGIAGGTGLMPGGVMNYYFNFQIVFYKSHNAN